MEKKQELYRGKAKTVFTTDDPNLLVMHYRDDTSAFDGERVEKLELKGETNNKINAFIMQKLAAAGIRTHFVRLLNDRDSLVRALKMPDVQTKYRSAGAEPRRPPHRHPSRNLRAGHALRYLSAHAHSECPR